MLPPDQFSRAHQEALIGKVQGEIFKLTNPAGTSGGTGWAVRTPSGQVRTLTNRHVCEVAERGWMRAHLRNGRSVMIHIIDVAEGPDLCLLEQVPGARGLEVAEEESNAINVVGHPRLGPLTPSSGFLLSKQEVRIADQDKSEESCKGDNQEWAEVPTIFGPMGLCFTKFTAWLTSASIHPGNSGSPIFDKHGDVAGVVFAGDPSTTYGITIPLDQLKDYLSIF